MKMKNIYLIFLSIISLGASGQQTLGEYLFSLFNDAGQIVHQYKINHQGVEHTESINLPSAIAKGIYRISLVGKEDRFTQSFLLR